MAIQTRRGSYDDFDPAKMLPGELATVTSGDPGANDGRSVYACFAAGDVKRMATYEDMQEDISQVTQDIQEDFTAQLTQKISQADTAISQAQTAISEANTAAQGANEAKQEALEAAEAAESYVLGDISNKTVVFSEASTRENINTGESTSTLFGKIKKWFSDLGAAAFHAVANNLSTNAEGSVLDARQGKVLGDAINQLNTNRHNATSALTETWFLGHSVRGWGLIVPICTNRIISVEKAEIYDDTSNWKPLVFHASYASSGNLWVQFTDDGSPSITTGRSYLVRITGAIV